MFGSKIMLMAKQWPCKESKFDSIMAPWRSSWRNKWTVPFERARARLFNAIFFPLRHWSGYWENWIWKFHSNPYLPLYKAATSHYRATGWDSNPWNPNCREANFKRTPRVLQVSAGAETECKMTARVPSLNFTREIDCAMASLMAKLRKTWILTRFVQWGVRAQRPDIFLAFFHFFGFFREIWCGAFFGLLLRFFSTAWFWWHFWGRRGYGAPVRKKTKRPKNAPHHFFRNYMIFSNQQHFGPDFWARLTYCGIRFRPCSWVGPLYIYVAINFCI